jgi:hypothetical protein
MQDGVDCNLQRMVTIPRKLNMDQLQYHLISDSQMAQGKSWKKKLKVDADYVKNKKKLSLHPMALQPISGLDLLSWGSVTAVFLWCGVISPTPKPQPGEPGLRIYDPWRQGGPAIPPGTG